MESMQVASFYPIYAYVDMKMISAVYQLRVVVVYESFMCTFRKQSDLNSSTHPRHLFVNKAKVFGVTTNPHADSCTKKQLRVQNNVSIGHGLFPNLYS
jgi:hypothetical protein